MITDNDSSNDGTPLVDWEVARKLTGGDDALLDELIAMFPEETAKHLEAIRIAIEQQDAPALTRAAHTLKSSAKLFGAHALAESALEMESLGQSSNTREADTCLPALQAETSRVIAALNQGRPADGREGTHNDE